ncbi:MAG TPA: hypothetical protein VNQ73_03210 [Ilumatobacter sp.]|nr:hypothetical protein [Ilumatobacter sp.]
MTDDQYLLASAYADGDVTADERAVAEADPEVMAEVARIRALGAALRDVTPAPAATREAMIAAALSEFGATDTVRAVAPSSGPRVHQQPSRWSRPLGLVAAAVALLAVGAVVVNGANLGGRDDDGDASTSAEVFTDDAGADMGAGEMSREMDAPTMLSDDGSQPELASGTIASDAPLEPDADLGQYTVTDAAESTDAPGSTIAMATEAPSAPPGDVIESSDDLAAAGIALLDAYTESTAPSVETAFGCTLSAAASAPAADSTDGVDAVRVSAADEHVVLFASRDVRTGSGDVVEAFIAVDTETAQTYAIGVDDCVLVRVGTAP